MWPSSTLPTMWSRAWNSRFGSPSRLSQVGLRGGSRAGRARRSGSGRRACAGLAVRRDGGDPHGAVLVGDVLGLAYDGGAGRDGLGDAPVDVGDLESDVDDAVAVPAVVVGQRAVGVDRAVEHEPDRAGAQHERLVVAVAGLGAGVGLELHAPRRLVVVRGLGGVADDEHDRVPAGHREDVGLLVVLHQPDQLLQLLQRQVGLQLVLGQGARWGVSCVVVMVSACRRPASCATQREIAVQSD